MSSNPPSPTQRHDILGLPLWAWGLGLGAFVIGVFVFFRYKPTGTSTSTTSGSVPIPVPYPTPGSSPSGPTPSQQQAQGMVKTQSIWGQGGNIWVFSAPGESQIVGEAPDKTDYQMAGPMISGGEHTAGNVTSAWWQPIKWGNSVAYLWGPESTPDTPTATSISSLNTQAPIGVYPAFPQTQAG